MVFMRKIAIYCHCIEMLHIDVSNTMRIIQRRKLIKEIKERDLLSTRVGFS